MAVTINLMKNVSNLVRKTRTTFFSEFAEVYKPAISKKKQLIEVIKEKAELAGKSEIAGKLRVAKEYFVLEMAPPVRNAELQMLIDDATLVKDFFKNGAYKFLTVKQAFVLFVISLEVFLWFFLGETIGKFHLIGYSV